MKTKTQNLGKVAITVDKEVWSADKAYDILTVVQDSNRVLTYLSRQPVPKGTPLNDNNYWVCITPSTQGIQRQIDAISEILQATLESVNVLVSMIYNLGTFSSSADLHDAMMYRAPTLPAILVGYVQKSNMKYGTICFSMPTQEGTGGVGGLLQGAVSGAISGNGFFYRIITIDGCGRTASSWINVS